MRSRSHKKVSDIFIGQGQLEQVERLVYVGKGHNTTRLEIGLLRSWSKYNKARDRFIYVRSHAKR